MCSKSMSTSIVQWICIHNMLFTVGSIHVYMCTHNVCTCMGFPWPCLHNVHVTVLIVNCKCSIHRHANALPLLTPSFESMDNIMMYMVHGADTYIVHVMSGSHT